MRHALTFHTDLREILSTITSKGQLTIPKVVRAHLGVSSHDKVAFVLQDDGTVKLRAPEYPTIASLAGAAGALEHALAWEEMRVIAREDTFTARREETRDTPITRPPTPR